MTREQACNDDVDAAVDAFFNGTLDARVDAAAARDGGEDVGGAVPGDGDGANARGRRGAMRRDGGAGRGGGGGDGDESDDAMMMDSDDEDWRAGESDSPIDLLGEEDEDEDEVNARMMRDIVAARERREGRSTRDRIGFEGPSTFAPGVGGDFDLPEGIDREEAKMLEAAMLGVAYIPPDNRVPDYGASAPAPACCSTSENCPRPRRDAWRPLQSSRRSACARRLMRCRCIRRPGRTASRPNSIGLSRQSYQISSRTCTTSASKRER